MNIAEMSLDQKINALHDWISNLDEYAMDALLLEYLGYEGDSTDECCFDDEDSCNCC